MRKIKGLVLSASLLSAQGAWAALPELPRAYVDTDTVPAVTGQTFTVNAGQSIQTAINNAAAANDSLSHHKTTAFRIRGIDKRL